jgi:hypothetical protein
MFNQVLFSGEEVLGGVDDPFVRTAVVSGEETGFEEKLRLCEVGLHCGRNESFLTGEGSTTDFALHFVVLQS